MTEKLCKDCVHFEKSKLGVTDSDLYHYGICKHINRFFIQNDIESQIGHCGEDKKHFEPKLTDAEEAVLQHFLN